MRTYKSDAELLAAVADGDPEAVALLAGPPDPELLLTARSMRSRGSERPPETLPPLLAEYV